MSRRWQTKNTDRNEKKIVAKLREIPGVMVETGHDDLLVGYKGRTYWFEVKNPNKINKDGTVQRQGRRNKTQEKQDKLLQEWPGQYNLVWNLDQILTVIGLN